MQKAHDIKVGDKFDKWRVLSFDRRDERCGNYYWNVVCLCGQEASVQGSRLVRGESTQCRSCACRAAGRKGLNVKHAVGDLYVVKCGRYFKIGSSTNVERRLADLQASNPMKLELLYHGVGEACDEAMWHAVFAHRHHRHEWFKM